MDLENVQVMKWRVVIRSLQTRCVLNVDLKTPIFNGYKVTKQITKICDVYVV